MNTEEFNYLSPYETAILKSSEPIHINHNEEVTVLGQKGVLVNKSEIFNWNGKIPISDYPIFQDLEPEIIIKKSQKQVEYIQGLAIRYLKPPTPPPAGDIIITQEPDVIIKPAPPIIIRQLPQRPLTPKPLIIREKPPKAPVIVNRKVITISGKKLPPPPRKVVIERLAPLPSKPQAIIIERWLPYDRQKRRVVFNRSHQSTATVLKPKNIIIEWETPEVVVKRKVKDLGIIKANPIEYSQRYGDTLKSSNELPQFVLDIKTPDNMCLAADYKPNFVHELEGHIDALKLIDLDSEGLSDYKSQVPKITSDQRRRSSESYLTPESSSGRGSEETYET